MNYIKRILKPFKFLLLYIFNNLKVEKKIKNIDYFLHKTENSILFISHALGGGTKQYENNFIVNNNKTVLIL